MNKEKELKAIKNSYDIITKNMNILLNDLLSVYADFTEKEELNNLINICQDFNSNAVTRSNNIIIKLLDLQK